MKLSINLIKEPPEEVKKFQKIAEDYELEGEFNKDVNIDNVDGFKNFIPVNANHQYIKKGFKNFFKTKYYSTILRVISSKVNKYLNTKVIGKEKLKAIKGAIVTGNHISLLDTFVVRKAVGHKMKFIAAEFNNWKGIMGQLARYNGMLPLSSNMDALKNMNRAVEHYLDKGKKVLIYPEQAMWRNYEKPRPMKDGAFRYAAKFNVPILPTFITFTYTGQIDEYNGAEIIHYTIHILDSIYPKFDLNEKENAAYLRKENYNAWKECYEKFYNKKLEYTTTDKSKIKI